MCVVEDVEEEEERINKGGAAARGAEAFWLRSLVAAWGGAGREGKGRAARGDGWSGRGGEGGRLFGSLDVLLANDSFFSLVF